MARGRCHIYYVFITVKLYMARGRCPIYYVFITVKLYMARGRLCIKARRHIQRENLAIYADLLSCRRLKKLAVSLVLSTDFFTTC